MIVDYHMHQRAYDLERYVEAVVQAPDRGLPVKLGLEVDYVPGREEALREILAPYPWDYLLGSVHFVDLGVDLVKIFGDRVPFDYGPAAEAIAQGGVAAEVSTAGLRKPVRELYPHPDFLRACRERGVPATLGSDAHEPELVGRDFDRARELLRSAGYETVTVFEKRSSRQEPLG